MGDQQSVPEQLEQSVEVLSTISGRSLCLFPASRAALIQKSPVKYSHSWAAGAGLCPVSAATVLSHMSTHGLQIQRLSRLVNCENDAEVMLQVAACLLHICSDGPVVSKTGFHLRCRSGRVDDCRLCVEFHLYLLTVSWETLLTQSDLLWT